MNSVHMAKYKMELTYPLEISNAEIIVKYNETLLTLLLKSKVSTLISIEEILINDHTISISSSRLEKIRPYGELKITMPIYMGIYEDSEYVVIVRYTILSGENINSVAKKARVVFSTELPMSSP